MFGIKSSKKRSRERRKSHLSFYILALSSCLFCTIHLQAQDCDKNWILTRTYDENGNEIGTTKAFFDNNGKPTQTQARNESTGQVLANQTLYDLQQRPVITTLAAPINSTAFSFNNNFITTNGTGYNYFNFDGDPSNTSNPYLKLNAPDLVDNTQQGSLGWYYSNNNIVEPMVGATAFPYSRVDYYHDGSGAQKSSSGVGEQLKMGVGHEVTSNSFPVQNELTNYLAIRNQFFPAATSGSSPVSMAGQALQSVSTDQNGLSVLSVTDLSGKMNLMTGRADPAGWLTVQNTLSLNNVQNQYSFNIHKDGLTSVQGNTNDPAIIALMHAEIFHFSVNSPSTITVTCTSGGIATWTGTGNNYVPPTPPTTGSYSFVITSASPFSISASNSYGTVYDQVDAVYAEPSGTSVQYFQLAIPSAVTVTGNYTLYDMTTEAVVPGFASGHVLPVGYYKIMATASTTTTPNNVTVTYTNKYSDLSYNYYNQLGQLIASIAPNGVQKIIQSGYSSYTSASQLPFVTLYQYDLQGRLISATTPDGGLSQYIYRQDGKIRFSQNAYQKNAANAGAGKVERFSYIDYDTFGRPVESGEYAVTTATFAGLAANTTLIEATGPAADIAGATKLSQINTYYDIPATAPSLVTAGYVQDAGFLKGAVSYTTNANSTTWYNYDDHGRVTWVVKQIGGLTGLKTVDYTYNDQGTVAIVDYQHGTAAERFMHYYSYDADGRLINVQTSTDGTTMVQHAHYYYYTHGPLKRVELGDQLQGMDYVYTPQGWLKAINSPSGVAANDPLQDGVANSFAKDAFGLQLEYFAGDYSRTGSNVTDIPTGTQTYYNGNVTGMSWQSNKPASVVTALGAAIQNPTMYSYTYDPKYQYNQSVWGTPNYTGGTFAAGTTFGEKGITYDANGNITALQRTNSGGTLSDNFTKYTYQANTNKLNSVGTTAAPTAYASYAYDELGRLKSEVQTGTSAPTYYLQYDVTGKITAVYSDAAMTAPNLKASYIYDENGNRIKTINATATTYYIYDASGNVLAIYTSTTAAPTPALAEVPVYGNGRLGTYFKPGANFVYEIRDNVGSVRVAINRTKVSGQADVYTYNDYYPYGTIARSGGTTYRYDYQGAYAEKDPVTGLNNFDLRMYDSRIGRWLSVDPAGQFASPYEGMGNNPVSGSDPTGGYDTWFGAFWAALWHGGGQILQNDNPDNINYKQYYYTRDAEYNGDGLGVAAVVNYGKGSQLNQWVNNDIDKAVRGEYESHLRMGDYDKYTGYTKGSGAVEPVYIEFDAALAVATDGGSAVAEIATKDVAKEGIYEFKAASGKKYVGQSGDIGTRIEQHIASGKLLEEDLHTLQTTTVLGGKTAREIAEQMRVNSLGGIYQNGVKVLENKVNPIGAARQYLLPKIP
ncbi:MAG: repeat-associated core domain protein [Mucilaginibacter sp.]|nr:repeat-associated core domain protein [Mucilaginibacter sp.]